MRARTLLTDRSDLGRIRWQDCMHDGRPLPEPGSLAAGSMLVEIEAVALTANTLTYGVLGEQLRYWDVFPVADPGWGCLPAWGTGRVLASSAADLPAGSRLFGMLPIATHCVLAASHVTAGSMREASLHRRGLPPAYQHYARLAPAPPGSSRPDDDEAIDAVLRPLFMLGFLLADQLLGLGPAGGVSTVVLTSASSKTAQAVAQQLNASGMRLVGLTSPRHVASCTRTGLFTSVLAYPDVDSLAAHTEPGGLVLVDIAGDASLRARLRAAAPGRVVRTILVGATHREPGETLVEAPGEEVFSMVDQIRRRTRDWGPEEFSRSQQQAWSSYRDSAGPRVTLLRSRDRSDIERAYREVLDGPLPARARPPAQRRVTRQNGQLAGKVWWLGRWTRRPSSRCVASRSAPSAGAGWASCPPDALGLIDRRMLGWRLTIALELVQDEELGARAAGRGSGASRPALSRASRLTGASRFRAARCASRRVVIGVDGREARRLGTRDRGVGHGSTGAYAMAVEFRLLGELDVLVDGRSVDTGHARQRCVLAALLVEVNRLVPADQLIDRVWADRSPYRAHNALSTYVSRLRQQLASADAVRIARKSGGYLLSTDPLSVDLHRFRHLVRQARAAGHPADAATLYGRALDLWHGEPFTTVDTPWFDSVRTSLHAERLSVVLDRNDVALRAGRHADLLVELAAAVRAHPLDEHLAGQLMLAQYRSGRQAAALDTHRQMRNRLIEELGADPGTALRQMHQQILAGDAAGPAPDPAPPLVEPRDRYDAVAAGGASNATVIAEAGPRRVGGVTVRLARSFGVSRDDAPEADVVLGGRKARHLLSLLASHRGRNVQNERIIEALWADTPPRRPVPDVATLVSRLRTALGPDVIRTVHDGYRLGTSPAVRVDLDEAARLIGEGERWMATDAVLAGSAAARALELLGTGPALSGEPDADWVRDVRAAHTALLCTARHVAATAALTAGDPLTARTLTEASVRDDRFDETAHRMLMAAHQAVGEPARALAVYERLRGELAQELGVDPAPETRAVFEAVLAERDATALPAAAEVSGGGHAPLVGRTAELAELTAAWSAAGSGSPAVLLLAGEGGIGKSRLAAELATTAAATGGQVLTARCYASERSLFLQPVVDALTGSLAALPAGRLRELAGARAGALAGLMPELVDVLGPAGPDRASPDVELRRVFEAVAQVLRGMTANRPTLLLLDDLHNAGTATVELLHYLARRAARSRLLVLATIRVEEGESALSALAEVAARIDIGPLAPDAVTRLAVDAGHGPLAARILQRTRGHTLFVVETLRGLTSGETHAPESLQGVVLARLSRAGPDTEELLRAGAVLGASVDPAIVGSMLDLPAHVAAGRCEQAAAARLLVVAGRSYEFANDLIQEVIYASTPLPVRVAYHRRAADLLADAPETMAAHALAAEDWPRAARAFLLAGEQAMHRWVAADAEALFGRALATAERAAVPELVARALLARGQARVALARHRPAVGDFQAALSTARQAGDRRSEMLALRELGGHAAVGIGTSMRECSARLRAGLRIAESLGDRGTEANLLGWLAVVATNRLQFVEAQALAQRAVLAGRAAGTDRALAFALDGLKTAHAYLGELGPLSAVLDELDPLLRRTGELHLLQWAVFESSFTAMGSADWAAAERRVAQAQDLNRRITDRTYEPWFVAHLGWLARLQGRLDDAVEHGRAAVASSSVVVDRWTKPVCEAFLGSALIEIGERAEAVRLLSATVGSAERDGAEGYRLRGLAPLAEVTGSAELLTEADALLTGISAPPGSAWLLGTDAYLSVARAWLAHGEPERARAVLAPLLDAAVRLRWIPALATGGLVDGIAAMTLGDPAAPSALTRVAELAARHGMPLVARAARRALA